MDPFTIFVTVVSIISGVASYQQAKKIQREVDRESRGVEANIESNIKAIPVVYGERRVGGVRVYIDTSKDIGNKYLYMVMAMAEGEVEDIHSIEIDDVPITDEKFILSGLGANFTYEVFYGSDTQSASDLIIDGVAYSSAAEVPPEVAIYLAGQEGDKPWNQNHKLNGVAYLAMRFLWDSNAYNGVPNVTAIVKGKKVYDPRNPTAPKAWSTNPALCIRDYLTSTRYGKGIPASAINDVMIAQAANDYDSFVVTPYDGGDDITLFEMNTVLDTEVEIIKNLNDMLMSCRGFLPYVDGKYGMRVDQATNHVMEVNSDHIIGGISIAGTKKEDRFNQVKVNFFNKDKEYKEDTAVFPDVDDPSDVNNLYQTYLAEDGGEPLVDDIKIDGISNYYTAREMAKLFLLRSRLGTAIGFTGTSELMELEVGDTFLITQPTPAWTNKKFQVQEIGLNFDGTVNIQAIEYSDAIYTYNTASEETPFVPTKLPNPNKLAPVTAASASAGSFIDTDGRTVPFIDISWTAPNDALVDRYEIKYTINDEAVIYSAVAIDTTHRIVEAKGSYDIEIYAVNGFGAKSTGVTLSDVVAVADTSAPSDITGVSISSALQSISLKWTNPTEYDFDLVRIKVAATNAEPTTHSFEVRSDSFVHDIGEYSTTKHYWLAPVDRTGNVGNYVLGGTATTGSIAISDVPAVAGTFYLTLGNNDAPTNAEFLTAVGRNPIEGDVVVVNKAYFFTRGASAWTAVTEFIDGSLLVSGSVKASQIDVTGLITSGSLAVTGDLPTAVSDLTNDTGFITSVSWAEVTSKPTDLATDTDVDNAINDIKVSGRNLVSAISLDGSPTDGVYGGKKYARKLARNLSNYRIDNWDGLSKVRPSGKYSLSFWVKVHDASDSPITGDRTLTVDIGDANYTNYTVNSDWQYCTIENVNVSTYLGSPYYGFIDLYVADNIYIYVSNVKLEYGTKVTEWSPAPEDVESSAWYSLTGRANTSAPSNSDYLTAFNRNPVQGDILLVTDTNGTSKNYQYNGDSWDNIAALIRGDMLVSGTVTASQIAADAITAEKIDVTNLSAISADLGDITGGSIDINSGTFTVDSDGNLTGTSVNLTGDITAQTLTLTGAQVADSRNATSLILSSSQLDQSVVNLIDQRIEGYGLASSGDFKEDIGGFNNTIPDHPVLENFTHLNGKDVVIELTASSTWSGTGSPTYPPQYPNNDSSLVIEIQRRVSTETDWDNAVVVDTITNGASLNTVITGGTWVYGYSSVWFNGLTINYTFNDDPATGTYDYRAFIKTIGTNYTGVSKFYFEANEAGTASGGGVNNYADSFSIANATGIMTIGRNGLTDLTADISTYVGNQVSALVDSAPVTLDTLNELAAALGDDPNFAVTVTNSIANKASKSGDTFTGNVIAPSFTGRLQGAVTGAPDSTIWCVSGQYTDWGIFYDEDTPDLIQFKSAGNTKASIALDNGNINTLGTITASGGNSGNWNTAYGWGNHASSGYLTAGSSYLLSGDVKVTSGSIVYEGDAYMGFIPYPKGAQFRSDDGSHDGYIKIALPDVVDSGDDMISFWVDIYDYTTNESISLFVGGYNYATSSVGGYWYNCHALVLTKQASKDFNVRFGFDGTRKYIAIGEVDTIWAYPSVVVRDFQASFRGNIDQYRDDWVISVSTTALTGVDEIISTNLPVASGASKWTTSRSLSLTGDVTGSVSWDGSANASITTVVANDSHNHTSASGDFDVSNNLKVNSDGSGSSYLHLYKYVGSDGGLIFRNASELQWQNVQKDDGGLQWYSYARGGVNVTFNGLGDIELNAGDYKIGTTTVIDSNRTHFSGVKGYNTTATGTTSLTASTGIKQTYAEGWTAVFADYEPYHEYGLYHDNPLDRFVVTAGTSTNNIGSFSVTNHSGQTRTAYEKIIFNQRDGKVSAGGGYNVGTTIVIDAAKNAYFNSITGSASYHEFGDATGSVSNDSGWNARLNLAGTQHAKLDVKSVSDGIITSMYAHTGHGSGRIGTTSDHPLGLVVNGTVHADLKSTGVLNTSSGYEVGNINVIDSSLNATFNKVSLPSGDVRSSGGDLIVESSDDLFLRVNGLDAIRIFQASGALQEITVHSHVLPNSDNTYDLGVSTRGFRDLYLSDNLKINNTSVIDASRNIKSVSTLSVSDSASNGTSNGMTHYQWDGSTYRNPSDWTARQVIRIHNDTTGDNGHFPNLVLYNESGLLGSTVGLSFASREADGAGSSVPLAGIHATKTLTGIDGGWSSGSLTAYVKDLGARRNVWTANTNGSMTVNNAMSIGQDASAMDTTNLDLEVAGDASMRGGSAWYFGITTNSRNSWKTKLHCANTSTMYINSQALVHNNFGYGTSTFFISDASGMDVQTGGLLINGQTVIDSSRNIQNISQINGAGAGGETIVIGSNNSTRIKVRHVDGKHYLNDGDHPLYLNYDKNYPVNIGGPNNTAGLDILSGDLKINGTTVIDSNSNLTNIGTGSFSGNINVTNGANPQIIATSTSGGSDSTIKAQYSNGLGIEMRYDPTLAECFFDSTYPLASGTVYGDIIFRQKVGSTMVERLRFDNDNSQAVFSQSVIINGSLLSNNNWETTGNTIKINTGGSAYYAADGGLNQWKYLSLQTNGSTKWDIGCNESQLSNALQFRPNGGNSYVTYINSTGLSSPSLAIDGTRVVDSARNLTNIKDINQTEVHRPDASYSSVGNTTGRIKIALPDTSSTYDMMTIELTVYQYNSSAGSKIYISGHNWTSGWYSTSVHVVGDYSAPIYLARSTADGKNYIILGDVGTSWSYVTVHVDKVTTAGFYNAQNWNLGWSISRVTTDNTTYSQMSVDQNQIGSITNRTRGVYKSGGGYAIGSNIVIDSARQASFSNLIVTKTGHNYLEVNGNGAYEAMTRYNNSTSNYWYTGIRTSSDLVGTTGYHIYSSAAGQTVMGLTAAGELRAKFNVVAYYSDERLKTKVSNLDNALSKVCSLNGFIYVENDKARELGYNNTNEQVALSAQEVQNVLPQAVSLAPIDCEIDENGNDVSISGENYLTVDYAKLVPLLVEAIKELKQEIEELKNGTNSN